MMQAYYTEKIFPGLIAEVQRLGVILGEYGGDIMLQEDNDPSYSQRSGLLGAANKLREANWIQTRKHPAQSPDIKPY